jgi:hypothetical protein
MYSIETSCDLFSEYRSFALDERPNLVFSPNRTATYSTKAKVSVGDETPAPLAFEARSLFTKQS